MSLCRLGLPLVATFCVAVGPLVAAEPVLLRYKFSQGDRVAYRTVHSEKQSQTILDQKINTTTNREAVTSQLVDAIDSDGNAILKTKTVQQKTSQDGPTGKFEYDSKSSERDTGSEIGGAVTPVLDRLTGSEYEIKVSPRGRVLVVKGFAELIADLVKDNPSAALLAGVIADNDSTRHSEQEHFIVFSEKPVQPGDTWDDSFEADLKGIGKMRGKVSYVYEADDKVGERKTVRIGARAEVTLDLDLEVMGAKVTGTLSGASSEGTLQFDPVAGRIVSSKNAMSLTGQLSVNVGGMLLTIDDAEEHTTTSELLDKLPD